MNEIRKSRITSLEIAELSGKTHDNVLKAIRSMESAWVKVNGVSFNVIEYTDSRGRKKPMYELSKSQSLYIGTKFNDEARARLILRWEKLENGIRVMSASEQLLECVKLTIENEKQIAELKFRTESVENKVDVMLKLQTETMNELKALPLSAITVPELQVKEKVRKLVNMYCTALNLQQSFIWNVVYDRLYYNFSVSIKAYKKLSVSESLLDVAVRNGFIDKLYAIVSEMAREKRLVTI